MWTNDTHFFISAQDSSLHQILYRVSFPNQFSYGTAYIIHLLPKSHLLLPSIPYYSVKAKSCLPPSTTFQPSRKLVSGL